MKLMYLVCVIMVVSSIGCIQNEEDVFGTFSTEIVTITEMRTDGDICFAYCEDGTVYSMMPSVEAEMEVGIEYEARIFHHRFGDNIIIELREI